ncbi:MAG: ATP-binding cassette domain-containing protein [Candidatus Bathyarchaeia archaeon]|jgi:ABC-2 type transport system ATP-binding protein
MEDIIVVENLKKTYGKDIVAVDGISFSVKKGEVFGFLGPNGAGKSTTIKILTTLLEKTSGKATIDGLDVDADQAQVRRIIGYSSQDVGVDDDLTARENLLLQCSFHHIPKMEAKKKVDELLQTVRLKEAADRRLKTFSGGMRKRLDLASSLVSDPEILFLDEPTTGLDPQSRQDVWDYVTQLNRNGMTIFLTTQYMEEADRLANRLCIVDQGKIVAEGKPTELKAQVGADTITLRFKPGDLGACEKAKELMSNLQGVEAVGQCGMGLAAENGLTISTRNGSSMLTQIVRAIDGAGISMEQINLSVPTLDEVFLKLTGKTLNVVERKEAVRTGARRGR